MVRYLIIFGLTGINAFIFAFYLFSYLKLHKLDPRIKALIERGTEAAIQRAEASVEKSDVQITETWLHLFQDLDQWAKSSKSSHATLPKIKELMTKYVLHEKHEK